MASKSKAKKLLQDYLLAGNTRVREGDVFTRYTVIGKSFSLPRKPNGHRQFVVVECQCGTIRLITVDSLVDGNSKSCGCLARELQSKRRSAVRHGLTCNGYIQPLYLVWHNMRQRCYKKTNEQYKNYGGRGISVCNEWRTTPDAFIYWAVSSGYKRGLTLDRIDNDGNYEPSNCRWTTKKVQANNTRIVRKLPFFGSTITISELSSRCSVPRRNVYHHIRAGKTAEQVIEFYDCKKGYIK